MCMSYNNNIIVILCIDGITVPPAQLQTQLNVDNIQMQTSPAYVSIDKKSPRLYQNI